MTRLLVTRFPGPGTQLLREDFRYSGLLADGDVLDLAVEVAGAAAGGALALRCLVRHADGATVLEGIAEVAPPAAPPPVGPRPEVARGPVTSEAFAATLAALMPEGAIVSDESITFGRAFYPGTAGAAPHDWLHLTGGAIGDGLPVATGAAIGAPGRRVISLQADGSAMYSLQSLWTQARENLPCTTIIFANRKYQILIGELAGVGANPGPTALSMLDLGRPDLDWVALARGMGVEAARAATMEDCADLMSASFSREGPFLIELAT